MCAWLRAIRPAAPWAPLGDRAATPTGTGVDSLISDVALAPLAEAAAPSAPLLPVAPLGKLITLGGAAAPWAPLLPPRSLADPEMLDIGSRGTCGGLVRGCLGAEAPVSGVCPSGESDVSEFVRFGLVPLVQCSSDEGAADEASLIDAAMAAFYSWRVCTADNL